MNIIYLSKRLSNNFLFIDLSYKKQAKICLVYVLNLFILKSRYFTNKFPQMPHLQFIEANFNFNFMSICMNWLYYFEIQTEFVFSSWFVSHTLSSSIKYLFVDNC